jgi:hypothetical protein
MVDLRGQIRCIVNKLLQDGRAVFRAVRHLEGCEESGRLVLGSV